MRGTGAMLAVLLAVVAGTCGRTTDDLAPSAADEPYTTPGGQQVEVVGATPEMEVLLDWSFDRFTRAELAEPTVDRIEVSPSSPRCEGSTGWCLIGEGRAEVGVCLPPDRVGTTELAARLCVLHELAHLWLAEHTNAEQRRRFMVRTGAGAWRGPDDPWAERGVEQAADTLAWGLLGGYRVVLGRPLPECEQLPVGFEILTGVPPLTSCSRTSDGDDRAERSDRDWSVSPTDR